MITATEKNLGEALVSAKLMSPEQLRKAIDNVEMRRSPSLIVQLLEDGFLAFNAFQKFLNHNYKIRTAILAEKKIPEEHVYQIGYDLMKERMVIPVMSKLVAGRPRLALGMVNPLDEKTVADVEKKTSHEITPVLISLPDFKEAMENISHLDEKFDRTPVASFDEQIKLKKQREAPEPTAPAFQMIGLEKLDSFVSPSISSDLPTASTPTEFFGKNIKKYKEEVGLKLGLDETEMRHLKKESYSRTELFEALDQIKKSYLEKSFENTDTKIKIEGLLNAVIKKGLITKQELIVAIAVSHIFGDKH